MFEERPYEKLLYPQEFYSSAEQATCPVVHRLLQLTSYDIVESIFFSSFWRVSLFKILAPEVRISSYLSSLSFIIVPSFS